jgi:hypothetical protein
MINRLSENDESDMPLHPDRLAGTRDRWCFQLGFMMVGGWDLAVPVLAGDWLLRR